MYFLVTDIFPDTVVSLTYIFDFDKFENGLQSSV
jgi:hypothetical protein